MRVGKSQLLRPGVHQLHERAYASAYRDRRRVCRVVPRREQYPVKQVAPGHPVALAQTHGSPLDKYRERIHGEFPVEAAGFNGEQCGHDLRGTCHRAVFVGVLFPERRAGVRLNDYRADRRNVFRSRHSRHGDSRGRRQSGEYRREFS